MTGSIILRAESHLVQIQVDTGHMRTCTSCEHDAALHASLHGSAQIDVGNRSQLLVDDYLVHEWENLVRVLESPKEKTMIDLDEHDDIRYGCPCTALEVDGKVRLFYQSGPSIFGAPEDSWLEDHNGVYSYRHSDDGRTGWTSELGRAEVEGHEHLGTFGAYGFPPGRFNLPPRPGRGGDPESRPGFKYMAGYEGRRGRACIAYSHDGVQFSNLDNDQDRKKDGLNDDCLTEDGASGANSILARAADTYIVPIVDTVRNKEYIMYRKDFGYESSPFESMLTALPRLRVSYASSLVPNLAPSEGAYISSHSSPLRPSRAPAPMPDGAKYEVRGWLSTRTVSRRSAHPTSIRRSRTSTRSGTSTGLARLSASVATYMPCRYPHPRRTCGSVP